MSRRSIPRFNFFLSSVVFVIISLFCIVYLVSRYPWPIFHSDFSLAKDSNFLGHWPLSGLEEDRQERKKLRRFPKSEQQRRYGILMRRMEYLNVPLFDFFLDQGVQYLTTELPVGVAPSIPLIWPSLPTKRKVGSEDSSYKDVRYVVLPTNFGSQCVEGIHLSAGDELRVALPPAALKRNIVFNVFPLTPSSLRASLGQFSWARQFSDLDVNRLQAISIPVNDPAAAALRLSLNNGNILLTSGSVARWERFGRLPIQVGAQSAVWRSAEEKTSAEVGDSADIELEEEIEDSSSLPNVNSSTTPSQSTTPQSLPTQMPQTEKEKTVTASLAKKKSSSEPSKSMDELFDPETVKYNSVISVTGTKSVALGYNVLLIQLDPLMSELFADDALFLSIAPHLHSFLATSVSVPVHLPAGSMTELFQHTVVRRFGDPIPLDLPILTQDLIAGRGVFNLYQEFRNFGYKVVSFAPHKALSMPESLAHGSEIPRVEGRWLDSNDWKFVARRRELDQQNEPVTGLEAIFKNDQSSRVQSTSDQDYARMAEMLEGLERESSAVPDWKANELAIINDKRNYLPRLIDSFQRWLKENSQLRFFAHVYLSHDDKSLRPSFKDFLKVLKYKKLRALAFPAMTERLSRLVMLDRVFGNFLDALVARRNFNRTVVGVLIPNQGVQGSKPEGRFLINVPGLVSRNSLNTKSVSLDDVLSTFSQVVGVQLNQLDSNERRVFKGQSIEADSLQIGVGTVQKALTVESDFRQEAKDSVVEEVKNGVAGISGSSTPVPIGSMMTSALEQVSRFRLIVLPRASGCQPFEWIASTEYFGLAASQPIVEEPFPRGRVIRVFPCSLRNEIIELNWFQSHSGSQNGVYLAQNINSWLGGSFRMNLGNKSAEHSDNPLFLIGPQAFSLSSLPFRLQKFSPTEIQSLFDLQDRQRVDRETLTRVLNLSSQIQFPQMTPRTLVYFFREPVRR